MSEKTNTTELSKHGEPVEFVRTGWVYVTDTMAGPYLPLEGSTPEDTEPVLFATRDEAGAEYEDHIDMMLEALAFDFDGDPDEREEYLEAERDALESEGGLVFAGIDADGEVFELEPETLEVIRPLHRPDR